MLKMVNSNSMEKFNIIENRYANSKILLSEFTDDCKGNLNGKVYAVSSDRSSYGELQDICNELRKSGFAPIIIGSYGDVYVGVQYEYNV